MAAFRLGSSANGNDADSDGSDCSDDEEGAGVARERRGGKRSRGGGGQEEEEVVVAAEWSEANLQKLLGVLVSRGYGKWEAIQQVRVCACACVCVR